MKNMYKMIFGTLVFAACLVFSSCSYLVTGFYRVDNHTQFDVIDFTVKWELDGKKESEIIELISAGTKSNEYAVILNDSRGNVLQSITSNFTISYVLNGKEFTVCNSKSAQKDANGNVTDPWAYFRSDKSITIDIFDTDYIIMHE